MISKHEDILWGVELSCFALKLQSCMHYSGRSFRRLPDQGSYIENAQFLLSLELAKRNRSISRFPSLDDELDEYPSVPFLMTHGEKLQYDSSAIGHWLDTQQQDSSRHFFPSDPKIRFVATLIDEAFDEFGLYMVHHMRWVGSAKSNIMGKLLAHEFRNALPPGGAWYLSKYFPKRQVRRCPYLFSVAPKGYRSGMPKGLNPPSKKGFPETHTLLNESWRQYLKGMESILVKQPYLLGNQFTIADASAYGQLGMNLNDPEAAELMHSLAPSTYSWLNKIHQGAHTPPKASEPTSDDRDTHNNQLKLDLALKPLLNTIMSTFSALMIQNAQAYDLAKRNGENTFNEEAFDLDKAMYSGKLRGYPFKSVVKTFQVRVWREVCSQWQELTKSDQDELKQLIEFSAMFEH